MEDGSSKVHGTLLDAGMEIYLVYLETIEFMQTSSVGRKQRSELNQHGNGTYDFHSYSVPTDIRGNLLDEQSKTLDYSNQIYLLNDKKQIQDGISLFIHTVVWQ